MAKVKLSETARLTFFFASPRLFYLLKCETEINSHYNYLAKIRDSETLTSAQKSRLRDPSNFTKTLRERYF